MRSSTSATGYSLLTSDPLVDDGGTRIEDENCKQGLNIDEHTCVPRWHGEVMDYAIGLDILLQCAGKLNGLPPIADP